LELDKSAKCVLKTLLFLHGMQVQLALFCHKATLIILSEQVLIKRRLLIILFYYLLTR
jgi:hypothetical protein